MEETKALLEEMLQRENMLTQARSRDARRNARSFRILDLNRRVRNRTHGGVGAGGGNEPGYPMQLALSC